MDTMIDNVEFYNKIYKHNPHKWTNVDRDYMAFKMLSSLVPAPICMLDIGCGNGHTLALFHSQWPTTRYTGVDISDVAIDIARERMPWAEYYREIPDDKWDVITIMGVAEHFEDPEMELRRIGAHLAPGGLLYLEVPNCLEYSDEKTEGYRKTFAGSDQDEWHMKRESWEKIIRDAGLEIVRRGRGPEMFWEFIWILKSSGG